MQERGSSASVAGFCQVSFSSSPDVSSVSLNDVGDKTAASVACAFAPAISTSLFSLSIDKGYLGGYMAYFIFVCVAVLSLCATSLLPRDQIIRNKDR